MVPVVNISERNRKLTAQLSSEPLKKEDVLINFNPTSFNRRSNFDLENVISETWSKKCKENEKLFNGSKFRHAASRLKESRLELDVGLTCYKDLVGTNLSAEVDDVKKMGQKTHGDEAAYLSQPMGKDSVDCIR